jgi:spore maturation protein CgeB
VDGANRIEGGMANEELAKFYNGAKISLNIHRTSKGVWDDRLQHIEGNEAWSLGPRAFEIAACGGFQISDDTRGELFEVFYDFVPTFETAEEMEHLIREYLADDEARQRVGMEQFRAVQPCSFRHRAEEILLPLLSEVV